LGSAPTLVFCAGAVKAGTSWFNDYLRRHPECHLRSVKELHYFDFLEGGFKGRLRKLDREIAENRVALSEPKPKFALWKHQQLTDKLQLRGVLSAAPEDQIAAYMAYLTEGAAGKRLVADMTPEYGLLPVAGLQRLAGLLPDVRFIFIMREPVARLWSHVRMLVRRMELAEAEFAPACEVKLAEVFAGSARDVTSRSDYRAIYQRLIEGVPEAQRKVVFYEQLISEPGIRDMTGFLGLSYVPPEVERRVHEGVAVVMTADQRTRAAAWLRGQYEFVAETFGLPAEWQPGFGALRGVA
jgi:hypothetical protein